MQLLTLEPWKDESVLLRFEHVFEYNEDKNLSAPVVIDVQVCFGVTGGGQLSVFYTNRSIVSAGSVHEIPHSVVEGDHTGR